MSRWVRQTYETHHRDCDRYGHTFGSEERLRILRGALAGARTILDLGCRDGTLATRLDPGGTVVGLDIDFVALQIAARRGSMRVAQADLWGGLPVRSRSCDAVIAGEFLEHCPDPWSMAREVARVLTDDGVFTGSVPNAIRLKNRLRVALGGPIELDRTHLHSFSPRTLRECLQEAGFETRITLCESRFLPLFPSVTANTIVFSARRMLA